jgi:uncharacterized membrane-anchored protein
MTLEKQLTKLSDERVNHYNGLAARVALGVSGGITVIIMLYYGYKALVTSDQQYLDLALLIMTPTVIANIVYWSLMIRWRT